MTAIFVREGYRADLAGLPEVVRWRSRRMGAQIGGLGPYGRLMIRGEKGAEITPELRPLPGEPIIDKSATTSFYATDLDFVLTHRGISSMVFAGITTDVGVRSTRRAATRLIHNVILAGAPRRTRARRSRPPADTTASGGCIE